MSEIYYSATSLFKAFGYIVRHKWTWKYYTVLLFINFVMFSFTIYLLYFWGNKGIDALLALVEVDHGVVEAILSVITFLLSLLVAALLFNLLSSIVSAPVYALFSDRLRYEDNLLGDDDNPSKVKIVLRSILFESKKLLLIILFALILLPMNFVPVVGSFLYIFFNTFQIIIITGLDLLSPYLDSMGYKFRDIVKFILKHPKQFWPLLVISGFLGLIPVVNLISIPLSIVAAHIMYKRL